ncbi:MAG: hypothetical protein IJ669_04940 [Prevotella sp.]|nr:hypothetical protein [Prevotella sp.]
MKKTFFLKNIMILLLVTSFAFFVSCNNEIEDGHQENSSTNSFNKDLYLFASKCENLLDSYRNHYISEDSFIYKLDNLYSEAIGKIKNDTFINDTNQQEPLRKKVHTPDQTTKWTDFENEFSNNPMEVIIKTDTEKMLDYIRRHSSQTFSSLMELIAYTGKLNWTNNEIIECTTLTDEEKYALIDIKTDMIRVRKDLDYIYSNYIFIGDSIKNFDGEYGKHKSTSKPLTQQQLEDYKKCKDDYDFNIGFCYGQYYTTKVFVRFISKVTKINFSALSTPIKISNVGCKKAAMHNFKVCLSQKNIPYRR